MVFDIFFDLFTVISLTFRQYHSKVFLVFPPVMCYHVERLKERSELSMMKKVLSTFLAITLFAVSLTGCSNKQEPEASQTPAPAVTQAPASEDPATETEVSVMALKGPTAMGMVKLMNDAEAGPVDGSSYSFFIAAAVDEVTPAIVQGKVDIAAVPANLASVLYSNTEGKVKVLAINTLGILYIVENGDSITSVADLKGKTIYASGKGATPEYALNYILTQNGINPETDVTIEWKSEHTECLSAVASEENGIALLPQPFVTTAQMKSENLRVALDLNKEWDKLQAGEETASAMLTGVVVARADFIEEHPDAVVSFLKQYKQSVAFTNENLEDSSALIEKYDIVPAAVAKKAVPACNITCITGTEMKDKLSGYLSVLFEQNPKAVGGALPADDFYYQP